MLKYSKNFLFLGFLLLVVFPLIPSIHGNETSCNWEIPHDLSFPEDNAHLFEIDISTFNFKSSTDSTLIQCSFFEPISIENKLVNFHFYLDSSESYELIFTFHDSQGNSISSPSLMNWYGLPSKSKSFISLDPNDFENSGFDIHNVVSFNAHVNSDNIKSIQISNPRFSIIESYTTYSIYENLPIQSIIPGFFLLLVISFPMGFVLLHYSKLLDSNSFVIKLPWIFSFGFVIYLVYAYVIANFWISFETILFYLIFEYVFLFWFLKTKKPQIFFIPKTPSIIFIFMIIISGFVSLSLADTYGWPPDEWDNRAHASIVSLIRANHILPDGTSYNPISDLDFSQYVITAKGAHSASAGLSFLSDGLTITSMGNVYFFTMFLIPLLLTTIVYRLTNSVYFSSIMFVLSYFKPMLGFWYGDIMFNKWMGGLFPAQIGIFITLIILILFIELFSNKKQKILLMIPISICFLGVLFSYYAFIPIIFIIGVISLVFYFTNGKKYKILFLSILSILFLTLPMWSDYALSFVPLLADYDVSTIHSKYLSTKPFDPSFSLFPFWISSAIGLVSAGILFYKKKYRYFSIIVIIISIIHLLSISKDITQNYLFFVHVQRSLGLMFFLSFSVNLIMIYEISKIFASKFKNKLSSKKTILIKISCLSLIIFLLLPSFALYQKWMEPGWSSIKIPGGNDRNLLLWIYDNVDSNDLVLNDISSASQWIMGFKAQYSVNGWWQSTHVSRSYDVNTNQFEPISETGKMIVNSNKILQQPWNHEYITKTVNQFDIKYIYISERDYGSERCLGGENTCYPVVTWPWMNYSGDSRIAMYENHPDLELLLRFGNSALFKVIT